MNNNHTYPRSLQPSERETKVSNKPKPETVDKYFPQSHECKHIYVPYDISFIDYDDRYARRMVTQSVICVECDSIKTVGKGSKKDRIVDMNISMSNGSGGGAGGFGYTYKNESLGEKGRNGGDGGFGPRVDPHRPYGVRVQNPNALSRINTVSNRSTIMSSNSFKTVMSW